MTWRAVIIGLIGAWFIAGFGYVNDWILGLESFTAGHQIPVIVLGLMFVAVILLNPLLFRARPAWVLRPAEIGLVVVLTTAACSIPGRGLMEGFLQAQILPHHWNRVTPGWKERKILDYAPKQALVDVRNEDVLNRFLTGSGTPEGVKPSLAQRLTRTWGQVPWAAWAGPMRTWLPLLFLCALASVCLALIVNQQWSQHEMLSYPIADFTTALLDRDEAQALPRIFFDRMFWIGFAAIFLVRVNNGLCQWFPQYLIPVQMRFNFSAFATIWPSISTVPMGNMLLYIDLFPLAVAFAFFVSSEIALTLGLTHVLWVLAAVPMVKVGIDLSTDYGLGGWSGWQRGGSYIALGLMLLYTGRHFYKNLLVRAVTVWRRTQPQDITVWACRGLLVSIVLMIVLTLRLGLELPFAIGTVLLALLSFVVVSRISAETGLFFIHARWQPYGMLLAMFGGYAMGPESLVISALVCVVLCFDQSQVLMPYLVNGLKLSENFKLSPAKVGGLTLGMYVSGVVLAVVIGLCATYQSGTPTQCTYSYRWTPMMPFQAAEQEVLRLSASGALEKAQELPWYERLNAIHPKRNFVWAAGFGFVGVILLSFLRLRLPWWPLHPVLLLVWATWPSVVMWHSFLIGWLIKKASLRFGGFELVRKLRPLMIGIVAGEIVGALVFMIGGAVYFAMTGAPPISYRFFPR
ncbi:MAG: hypothetical protein A3K19_30010 [Lentisphaerae bacterium RIFOXYB12_FULL_65_16]|nr:MAG: hypothetical protein A3K18_33620 [Lentisphaerae bacterium RIFOXYA12_64_32]OGV86560.1 MAG: hypothetical protein A3K19_30010 [Lentisphaerae bacterium RIFOXYB12_FULL_65_16]